jgi:ABC-type ATPase involved in cell division
MLSDVTLAHALAHAGKVLMADHPDPTLSSEEAILAIAEGLRRAREEVLAAFREARERSLASGEVPS